VCWEVHSVCKLPVQIVQDVLVPSLIEASFEKSKHGLHMSLNCTRPDGAFSEIVSRKKPDAQGDEVREVAAESQVYTASSIVLSMGVHSVHVSLPVESLGGVFQ